MKYDVLNKYKDYLHSLVKENKISKLTANAYYSALNVSLKNVYIDDPKDLNSKNVKEHLYKIASNSKNQNKVSKLSNALKLFSECFLDEYDYYEDDRRFFKDKIKNKPTRRLTKSKKIDVAKVNKKIASIKKTDEKMYFAFKTMQLSGVRISTVCKLKKKDFEINDNKIVLNLRKETMKKNQVGKVVLLRDDKYFSDIEEYIRYLKDDDNLFPPYQRIFKQANRLGLKCHDFRRVFAKINFRYALRQNMTRKESKEFVKKQLCHRGSSYKKYLSAKAEFKNVDLNKYYMKHREGEKANGEA